MTYKSLLARKLAQAVADGFFTPADLLQVIDKAALVTEYEGESFTDWVGYLRAQQQHAERNRKALNRKRS